MFIRKLVFSNFAVHRVRMALTVAAVALSVSLVVAVTSGYSSLEEAAIQYLTKYMNSTDAVVARLNDPVGVPQSLLPLLRADKEVKRADGRVESYFTIPDLTDDSGGTKRVRTIGIERPYDTRTENDPMEAGNWFESSDSNEAVVDQSVAEILRLKVGDEFDLNNYDKKLHLHV